MQTLHGRDLAGNSSQIWNYFVIIILGVLGSLYFGRSIDADYLLISIRYASYINYIEAIMMVVCIALGICFFFGSVHLIFLQAGVNRQDKVDLPAQILSIQLSLFLLVAFDLYFLHIFDSSLPIFVLLIIGVFSSYKAFHLNQRRLIKHINAEYV